MNVIRWIRCINILFDKLMGLCYETLFPMHGAVVSISLAICNFHVCHIESILFCLKTLGGI